MKIDLRVPGLLFIDTPGHAAFANLRRRGGSIADLAILVVDITKGLQEQTKESLQLLSRRDIPFVVAANKVDLIPGWKPTDLNSFKVAFERQARPVREDLDERIYSLIGGLSFLNVNSDLFSRVTSFEKTVALVPVSAKTGEGISELLLVLLGLAQTYLKEKLSLNKAPAQGVVLEVKEEEGMGTTINAVIYDGVLRASQRLVLAGAQGPFSIKIRGILLPKPLDEMRDPRDKFKPVETVTAVAGVKIIADDLERTISGSPLYAIDGQNEEVLVQKVREELEDLRISTDRVGIILKADTLGSLEAAVQMLRERGVSIRVADIGEVARRDVVEADVVKKKDELSGTILSFNLKVDSEIEREANNLGIRIFKNDVMFRLVDDYLDWVEKTTKEKEVQDFESLTKPGRVRIMPGFVFRRSDPAIVGIEVLGGRIRPRTQLLNVDGKIVGTISQIQDKGRSLEEAAKEAKVAISLKEPTVGRQIHEGESLYVALAEREARALSKTYVHNLSEEERKILEETIEICRRSFPLWAR